MITTPTAPLIREWNSFKEIIDTEFRPEICPIQIETEAFRVDDKKNQPDGIRTYLSLERLKSCDYFYFTNEEFLALEFSDLLSQRDNSLLSSQQIKKMIRAVRKELGVKTIRPYKDTLLKLSIEKIICSEIVKKISNTDQLITKIDSHRMKITDCPDIKNLYSQKSKFIVIFAEHTEIDCIDSIRYFDTQISPLIFEAVRQEYFDFFNITEDSFAILPISLFIEIYCTD